jgi:hypothetical protein
MANEDNNDEMLRQILQSVTDLKAAMSACNSRIAALEPHSGVSFSRLPFHKSPDFPTLTTQVTTSQHFSILARSKNFFETPGCPTDRSSTPKAHQTLAGTDFGSRGPQHCVRLKNVITLCFKKLLKLLRAYQGQPNSGCSKSSAKRSCSPSGTNKRWLLQPSIQQFYYTALSISL